MRTHSLVASLVGLGLGLVLAGCTATTSPKDTAPVVGPTVSEPTAAPSPSPTATPEPTEDPSTEPSIGPTETPDAAGPGETDEPQAPDGLDVLIPDDEVLFTADELYSSAVNDLYDDVEAADRSNRIGICRSAAIVVGGLTKSEIEERRDAMAPDDVEALQDFVSLCERVLAS